MMADLSDHGGSHQLLQGLADANTGLEFEVIPPPDIKHPHPP